MIPSPYPGLRPFQQDEAHLFFGRDQQVADLLRRLGNSRFVAILGPSGCGKSSLVRAGLLPTLEGGFMLRAGTYWRFAVMRPGSRPIHRLAAALIAADEAHAGDADAATAAGFLGATLRRGPLGLIEALTESPLPADTNLLVLVDQFEEIFRFRREGGGREADAFVALLLASVEQRDIPIYVVITMRSDFIGDCALFTGLPELLNESQYLTPRLGRDERREAIVGPARVYGGDVEPALANHLLNEIGTDPDQLPVLQHLLMRMWTRRVGESQDPSPAAPVLTLADYEAAGGFRAALSNDADEAFEALDDRQRQIAEALFRRLSERGTDQREIRRPTPAGEIATLTETSLDEVIAVVDAFRTGGRTFLVPPAPEPIGAGTVLDISHESLIRQWSRLRDWAAEEEKSAEIYWRLEDTARRWQNKQADLLRGAELELALDWRDRERPTAAWAKRYGDEFDLAMRLLDASRDRRDRRRREDEARAQQELEQARLLAEAEKQRADAESHRARIEAESNQRLRTERRRLKTWLSVAIGSALLAAGSLVFLKVARDESTAMEKIAGISLDSFGDIMVKLRQNPVVPRADVGAAMENTEPRFVDLSKAAGERPEVRLKIALLTLKYADVSSDIGDPEGMSKRAERAATSFQKLGRPELVLDAVEKQAEAERLSGAFESAREKAGRLVAERKALLDRASDPFASRLALARAHRLEARVLDQLGEHAQALVAAEESLKVMEAIPEPEDKRKKLEFNLQHARCLWTAGKLENDVRKPEGGSQYTKDFDRYTKLLYEQNPKYNEIILMRAVALNNSAAAAWQQQDWRTAEPLYDEAAKTVMAVVEKDPTNLEARDFAAFFLRNRASTLDKLGEVDGARENFGQAFTHVKWLTENAPTIKRHWQTFELVLDDFADFADRRQSEAVYGRFEPSAAAYLKYLRRDLAQRPDDSDKQYRLIRGSSIVAETYKHGKKFDDRFDVAVECAEKADAFLVNPKHTDGNRALIKMLGMYCVQYLSDSKAVYSPETAERRYRLALAKLEQKATKDPRVWFFTQGVVRAEWNLGRHLLESQRSEVKEEGLRLINEAVEARHEDILDKVIEWYKSDEGPLQRDPERAAVLQKERDKVKGMKRFTVPATRIWAPDTKSGINFFVREPVGDENTLEEEIYRVETYEGAPLPEDVKTSFRKLWDIAKENNVSFVDLTVYALASAGSQQNQKGEDALSKAKSLFSMMVDQARDMGAIEAQSLSEVFALIRDDEKIADLLPKDLVRQLIGQAKGRCAVRGLAVDLQKARNHAAARWFADLLLETPGPACNEPLVDRAIALMVRSRAAEGQGDRELWESDLLQVIALAPSFSDALNDLGYGWVERDRNLPTAVALLERAVKEKPDNAAYQDSLGWAYVKVGRTEEAVPLLEKALPGLTGKSAEVEVRYHLGEAYWRLKRRAEADEQFRAALALKPEESIRIRIDQRLAEAARDPR